MKKTPFVFLILASFIGVLAALQLDHYLGRRAANHDGDIFLNAPTHAMPAAFEPEAGAPVDFRAASKKVIPSVVSVNQYQRIGATDFFGNQEGPTQLTETGAGSGVIISDQGYIVTNNHVVTIPGSNPSKVVDEVRVNLSDKRTFVAKVIGTDQRSDLALLKIEASGLTPIEMADSSKIDVGQWVVAVGNPLGFANTVSVGVVSSLNRSLSIEGHPLINGIQTDAAINPGNSGGALTNSAGQLVGINSAIATTNRGSIGIGFAIPSNRVKQVVSDILKYGHARYGGLGVNPDPRDGLLGDPRAQQEMVDRTGARPPTKGVLVQGVAPGSAAAKAGIEQLDVVTAIDGQPIDDSMTLLQVLNEKKPGDKVTVKYWTHGNVKSVDVVLQDVGS